MVPFMMLICIYVPRVSNAMKTHRTTLQVVSILLTTMNSTKTYLITGCSSGLGYCLARAALSSGAKVIATARNLLRDTQIYEDLKSAGAVWASLDVQSLKMNSQIQDILSVHKRIDVLINNAGSGGSCRPLEEVDMSNAQKVFDINLWGVIKTIQSVMPSMRTQGSGCIVNISSASVFGRHPGLGVYAASKAALDTVSAALAPEVAPFGVKVILVTPSDMRTPFVGQHKIGDILPDLGEAYRNGPVEAVQEFLHGMDGKQSIDPVRAAAKIVLAAEQSITNKAATLIRLPIGMDAAQNIREWTEDLLGQVEATKDFWSDVDYPER